MGEISREGYRVHNIKEDVGEGSCSALDLNALVSSPLTFTVISYTRHLKGSRTGTSTHLFCLTFQWLPLSLPQFVISGSPQSQLVK